jgi:hypothetical protein
MTAYSPAAWTDVYDLQNALTREIFSFWTFAVGSEIPLSSMLGAEPKRCAIHKDQYRAGKKVLCPINSLRTSTSMDMAKHMQLGDEASKLHQAAHIPEQGDGRVVHA